MKSSKLCPGCQKDLPRTSFYSKGYSKVTGEAYLATLCVECYKKDAKGNRSTRRVAEKKYEQTHREQKNAKQRRWNSKHPHRHDHEKLTYREFNSKGNRGRVKRVEWLKTIEAFNYCCAYCGLQTKNLEVDHFKPSSKDGQNSIRNFVPACRTCNASKGNIEPDIFLSPQDYNRVVKVLESLMVEEG